MISLAGKAAVITGGSRGIGAAAVKLFAQAGADVVFNYQRNREAAEQVEQEARKHGTRVESVQADLGRMAGAKKLIEHATKRLGRLDILVANAGIWNAESAPIEKLTEHEWDEMLRVNLKSVYAVIHFAAARMIAQRSGRIIAISSTAGQRGEAFHAHYAASKGAVISMVKGLSTELGASQHPGQLRGAGMGGYGYVQAGSEHEGWSKICNVANSAGPGGNAGGNCRADPVHGIRPGNLYHRRSTQCKRRSGSLRIAANPLKLKFALAAAALAACVLVSPPRGERPESGYDSRRSKARHKLRQSSSNS